MKVFGELEKAQLEQLSADPTGAGLYEGRFWLNTTSHQYKAYLNSTVVVLGSDTLDISEVDTNVNDLVTLSGVAENDTDLGSFTGSTISDSRKIKEALQDIETAHEIANGSGYLRNTSNYTTPGTNGVWDEIGTTTTHVTLNKRKATSVVRIRFIEGGVYDLSGTNYANLYYRIKRDSTVLFTTTVFDAAGRPDADDSIMHGTSYYSTTPLLTYDIEIQDTGAGSATSYVYTVEWKKENSDSYRSYGRKFLVEEI